MYQATSSFSNTFIKGILMSLIITISLLYIFASNNVFIYNKEVFVIIVSNLLVMILYTFAISKDKFDIFHTIHLITILYLFTFVYTPLAMISAGKTDCYGVDVMPGCIPATIIFTYSYLAFIIGYTNVKVNKNFRLNIIPARLEPTVLKFSWIIWFIAFGLSLVYLFKTGRSLSYILTLGNDGTKTDEKTDLLFLSNFSLCMIVPVIYIFKFQKKKLLFLIPLFLTFAIFYVRGFRIFIMIMIVGLFLFYFKSNSKRPSFKIITVFALAVLIFNTVLGSLRNGLRTGETAEVSLATDDILYTLESNFDIYKPFYGLVARYPSIYNFTWGRSTIVDTLAMWIPRSIWSSKPLPEDTAVPMGIRNATSDFSIFGAAMSWPNIAEFYMDFGPIGVAVIFYFFGFYSKKLVSLYYSQSINDLVLYSVSFTLLLQFIIRGSVSLFLPFVIFTLLPYFIMSKFVFNKQNVMKVNWSNRSLYN